jgi:hypothetical protein
MRILALAGMLAVSGPLYAAAVAPDKDSSTYDIEVLVFENRLPELQGDELLARDPATVRRQALDVAVPPETLTTQPTLLPVITDLLEKDGHYRILASSHWRQTLEANPKPAVKPTRIASAAAGELEGAVRFSLSRYLHLDVNMLFRDISTNLPQPVLYQIREQRRIKSQETNYFDHPRFGVLVRVMQVEKDQKP